MATIFAIQRKQEKYKKHIWVFYILWLFLAAYNWYSSKEDGKYLLILPPLLFLIIGLKDAFFPSKIEPDLVEIDADMLVWKTKEMPSKETVLWNDIEWIKFEKDGISFYRPSSFNSFLNTTNVDGVVSKKLEKLITEIATEKNIKLVS